MGYFNSAGQWVNTPPSFQGAGMTPQQPNGVWGGGMPTMQNQVSVVPINGGRAAAEDYPVAPGAKVILVDTNELVTYVKERDMQGRAMSFLVYDWNLREEPKPEAAGPAIDYEKIRSMITEEVQAVIGNRQQIKPKKENK